MSEKKYDRYHKRTNHEAIQDSNTPKIVKRNYHVSPMTAYNIRKLSLQFNCSEGKVVDKIIRSYLASRGDY